MRWGGIDGRCFFCSEEDDKRGRCRCEREEDELKARRRDMKGHSWCGQHGLYRGDPDKGERCPACEVDILRWYVEVSELWEAEWWTEAIEHGSSEGLDELREIYNAALAAAKI